MIMGRKQPTKVEEAAPKYPGIPEAMDGSSAVVAMETAASEAAGAYPITPSTQMGEGWALAVAAGTPNVNGRRLLFFEPEGEHAAAGVTAGMSMVGLRATNFSSGQGIAYMHESLYAAAGKRLTYVLNVAARAMTKHALNVHAGHDDYHCVDDTGFFQLFAKDVQEAADLNLIAHRVAELSLNPGLVAQDGFLTSHVIESMRLPERELVKEYLGDPADQIESPTPAQRLVFGQRRRRIPELFDFDYPAMLGTVQNQESYAQGVAAQRPFYFDHIQELTDLAMAEYAALTGRRYERAIGYRLDDAEWVLAGQGSVVTNAEAVADHLRETSGLKVGVLNLTMFRPFPSDLVTDLLRGKKGVTVLERVDQPLAVDPPLLREIRAAMGKALENGRAKDDPEARRFPFATIAAIRPHEMPDFYSAGFGFGSRDLQPGDLAAAVQNMLDPGERQRQYYLGIDFIRRGTRLPKLQIWQEELLDAYPHVATLALPALGEINLLPKGSIALRIHSVGGWGAITMGKNVAMTAFELAGLQVKANPKYGSEKKGQPTTFYAVLAHEPVKLNAELKHVDVVLSPDANVFRHSNPLAGLSEGGVFIVQSDQSPEETWRSFPAQARRTIRERKIRTYALDGFAIAAAEASDAELRYRMQGAAFMGAFFHCSPLAQREGLSEQQVLQGIEEQTRRKFGKLGERVVEDNLRVIRRGFAEVVEIEPVEVDDAGEAGTALRPIPTAMEVAGAEDGIGNAGRFFEQVCSLYATGQDPLADPFTALSALPAATSAVRDMTSIRFEVPEFHPEKCTGCSQCWVQCPDAAIPGLVNTVEALLDTAVRQAAHAGSVDRVKQVAKHLAKETRKLLQASATLSFADALAGAHAAVADRLGWEPDRRAELDREFSRVHAILAEFAVARTAPFYDLPERKEKGSGGLLSITVNPEACKGCNICVDVCPEGALVTVKQDEEIVDRLRRNWKLWEALPDTDDRYVAISSLEEGIGVLSSLLLRKAPYRSMTGGDGACMGCGEKTTVHLVTATIEALMQPRVRKLVERLEGMIAGLDRQARDLLSAGADLDLAAAADGTLDLPLDPQKRATLQRLNKSIHALKDLKWRYEAGPSGRGRAALGITNSTGCSSVWGATYPFNPYPFPWVNHLFQDAPSVAIGIFEGHMRKMADAFADLRRAEKLLAGEYDEAADEARLASFDWREFTDEEFGLCPPLLVIGGDGAMLDIGFQNLSRLMASGKPIRVMVLDTQVYSNTGGQASTATFTGQAADMSPFGKAQHGKTETRKELALIAMAHRGTYVLQSSQSSASHLIGGVLRGLQSRRPALFNIYTPCPVEHGLPDEWAPTAAKLALESRAFPYLVYDPDAGESFAERLSLDGNPALESRWPTYELEYVEAGEKRKLELPVTIADWAATEGRFKKHFRAVKPGAEPEGLIPFHELIDLPAAEREGLTPFIHVLARDGGLGRMEVSPEIVRLAEDRLEYWAQLRELAGLEVSEGVRDAVGAGLEAEFEGRLEALRADYEAKLAELKATYPRLVARKLAEGLVRSGNGTRTVADLLSEARAAPPLEPIRLEPAAVAALVAERAEPQPQAPAPVVSAPAAGPAPAPAASAVAVADAEEDEALSMEPYIETERCTSCNECTNLNNRLFAYNAEKQAYIKDARAGTFAQLVQAAEKCPAGIIHPGTPLNPKEKDLAKWVKRAEAFNA